MGILIPGYDNHAVRSRFPISTFSALVMGDLVKRMMTMNCFHTLCIDKGVVYAHRPDFKSQLDSIRLERLSRHGMDGSVGA